MSYTKLPLDKCPDLYLYLKHVEVPMFRMSVLKAIRKNMKSRDIYVRVSSVVGLKPISNVKGVEQHAKNFETYSNGKSTLGCFCVRFHLCLCFVSAF